MSKAWDETLFRETAIRAFRIPSARYRDDLALGQLPEWDSIAHLDLVFLLEQAFSVRFAMERIPSLDSLPALRDEIRRLSGS